MATKTIRVIVVDRDSSCPVDWTVEVAKGKIRSHYALIGWEIENNGVLVTGSALISSLAGPLTLVEGPPARSGITFTDYFKSFF